MGVFIYGAVNIIRNDPCTLDLVKYVSTHLCEKAIGFRNLEIISDALLVFLFFNLVYNFQLQ